MLPSEEGVATRCGNRRPFCATMGRVLQIAGPAGPDERYTDSPSYVHRLGHHHAVDS